MGGVSQNELSPEESMLMAKHALLEKRKKELEELQAKYRLMQEQQKRSNQKLAACETPSEATEIAKKLAASGQLITAKGSGSRTGGFKRTARALKTPEDELKEYLKEQTEKSQENEEVVGSLLKQDVAEENVSLTPKTAPKQKFSSKRPKMEFVKGKNLEDDDCPPKPTTTFKPLQQRTDPRFKDPGKYNSVVDQKQLNVSLTPKTAPKQKFSSKRPKMEFVKGKNLEDDDCPPKPTTTFKPLQQRTDPRFKDPDSAELQNIETANDKPFSQKGNTIFIKNLGMTKTLARKLCVPYGEVIDVTADKSTRCFVTFSSVQAAEVAIEKLDGLQLTEEIVGEELVILASLQNTILRVYYAKKQRHMDKAQDLKHDWSRISAAVKPIKQTAEEIDRTKKRNIPVYDDEPF